MRVGTVAIASLSLIFTAACSSSDSGDGAPGTDSGSADSAALDTGKPDASGDGTGETSPDTGRIDTGTPDTRIEDAPVGVTFPCGSETCSANFQYCKQMGTCAAPDAGAETSDADADADASDDAPADTGTGDTGSCTSKCVSLPAVCFGGASCACILNEVCGSPSSGTCDEKPLTAFTVECTP
jgi:hypothetical protein